MKFDDQLEELTSLGFMVVRHSDTHAQAIFRIWRFDLWPSKDGLKCMIWGRIRVKTPHELLQSAEKMRIPEWASEAECRYCGEEIFWVTTEAGKKLACEEDGASHFGRCPER